MKKKTLNALVKILSIIAIICVSTPSKLNTYEPDVPKMLKKENK